MSQQIVWVQTVNKTNIYPVNNSSSISISNNILNFATVRLKDEEYYGCGSIANNILSIYDSYFVFVRGRPEKIIL